MSTQNVERELTVVLHRHAQDAMDSTDTQAERERLYESLEAEPRTDRRRLAVGALAAAAVVAAFAVAAANLGDDRADVPPTNPPDSAVMSDLEAAEGFAAAVAALDADGAATYLAPGTDEPWPDWTVHLRGDAAWNVKYQMEPCVELSTNAVATTFRCPYSVHMVGSEEVGKGPFPDNTLDVFVKDGDVLAADIQSPWETNGIKEHMDSVLGWIEDNHPQHLYFLTEQDEAEFEPSDWSRFTRLWQQYIREYVEATNAD